jgi:iron(III) transport system permease protein
MIRQRNIAAVAITSVIALPVLSLVWIAFSASSEASSPLVNDANLQALWTTVLLCGGVTVMVSALGVGTAWLVVAYDFKSRRILSWALLLPLAVPTYIVAYVYLDFLHPLGPVQELIRGALGYSSPKQWKFGDIRGISTAIILLGFVLYPYVYLSARAMFMTQPANLLHAARTLGRSEISSFWFVALPMARPAIAIGLSLALLETLNDIGASEFLGVRTLTVSIYTNWHTHGDLGAGVKLAMLMLIGILAITFFMRDRKKNSSYANMRSNHVLEPRKLKGSEAIAACLLGWTPVAIGFVIPSFFLFFQVLRHSHSTVIFTPAITEALFNTVRIAAIATAISIVLGTLIVWSTRDTIEGTTRNTLMKMNASLGKIGYALPGTMIAIGLLLTYGWLDSTLQSIYITLTHDRAGFLMLGSFTGVAFACSIRFVAIAIGNITAGFARIPISLDHVARLLGRSSNTVLFRVHLPLIQPALIASTLLIFVECMKELPVTLMLRPLNTETLATLLYADASRGNYEESAIAALIIVMIGIIPVMLLTRINRSGKL